MIEFTIQLKGENVIEDLLELQVQIAKFQATTAEFYQKTSPMNFAMWSQMAKISSFIGLLLTSPNPDNFLDLIDYIQEKGKKILKEF
jgi:hypothetical protein